MAFSLFLKWNMGDAEGLRRLRAAHHHSGGRKGATCSQTIFIMEVMGTATTSGLRSRLVPMSRGSMAWCIAHDGYPPEEGCGMIPPKPPALLRRSPARARAR